MPCEMPDRMSPRSSRADILRELHGRRNWDRWGPDDEKGALNLITPQKRIAALSLAKTGDVFSLSRPFPTEPGPTNPYPAQHYLRTERRVGGGAARDFYGIDYHGMVSTHIDALCHTWDDEGMWGGKNPAEVLGHTGSSWGAIDKWRDGIITRGVLLDVTRFRGEPYVTHQRPVTGEELDAVAAHQRVDVQPGDAALVYSGRDRWDREHPPWGSELTADGQPRRPGLHGSCLKFVRDRDIAVLGWDMQDQMPNEWGIPWTVHGATFAFGVALVDHCELSALADECARRGVYEFAFIAAPLVVEGGTGSPVNPLAIL